MRNRAMIHKFAKVTVCIAAIPAGEQGVGHNNMGYRRKKNQLQGNKKWEKFCNKNKTLMNNTGLPSIYLDNRNLFDDFLMHGYIDHHDDPIRFTDEQMTDEQISNLRLLIRKYFEAGFCDPGIILFTPEEKKQLAKEFPNQIIA